jgi:hypothetical protein
LKTINSTPNTTKKSVRAIIRRPETKLFFCLFMILIVFLVAAPLGYALKSAYTFDRATYYQGQGGTVTVTITNDNPLFQWNIRTVAIQFDSQGNLWYSKDVNTNVAPGQSYTIAIDFSIDNNLVVGSNSFSIKYVGMFGDTHTIARGVLYISFPGCL